MSRSHIEGDYLVIGAGATAMLGRFRSMIGPVDAHLPSLLSQIPA